MLKEVTDVLLCRSCILQRQLQRPCSLFYRRNHGRLMNHYDVLGVKNDATQDEIRHAYVSLSKLHHPDKTGDPKSNSKFVQIHNAYSTLSKSSSRREYDFSLNETLRRHMMMQSMMQTHYHGSQATPGSGNPESSSNSDPRVFWDETIYSMRDKNKDQFYQNAPPYYGIKGFNKFPNVYIVLGCVLFIVFGAAVHTIVINTSSRQSRRKLDERDKYLHGLYKESKLKAKEHGNALQLQLLTTRIEQSQRKKDQPSNRD